MLHNPDILHHRKHFGKFASLPIASDCFNIMTEMPDHHRIRKRRRGEVANPANTLDGLVAKRADDVGAKDSLYKRYLTEAEAIDAPIDDQRIEIDPDVSTRTCSICGYQGKWISEMIRHKRVHTNERPFRCKYCSRTSKWKADLVRHVAKTHGIRVVSKYSRSKTFHNGASALNLTTNSTNESNENRRNCVEILTDLKNGKDVELRSRKPKTLRLPMMYRCTICLFEQDSVLVLMSHLKNAHNAMPYECHSCGSSFMDAHTTMKHFIEKTTCKRTDLKINIAPPYTAKNNSNSKPSFAFLDEAAKRAAQELFSKSSVVLASAISTKNASGNATLPVKPAGKNEMKQPNTNNNNRNEIIYNCIFCNWTAKKMCVMKEHMHMHKTNPSLTKQPIDEIFTNSAETKMKVNLNGAAMTEQALATSRYFDLDAILSVMKQQATVDPLLSMQALTSTPTLLSEWISPGPSAFKQVTPVLEEIIPVTSFMSYPRIHEIQQKKIAQQLNSLFFETPDNISCNSVTVISNFFPDNRSKNSCFFNSNSSYVSEKSSIDSNMSDAGSLSFNHHISEGLIKTIEHCCQRHDVLFSPTFATESKTQRLGDFPELPENKTKELEAAHDRNITRKEEDDFVDVVQLDA